MIYFLTVNYYSTNLITKLIDSILSSNNCSYKLVIVNNSPDDADIRQLQSESAIVLEPRTNLGFGQGCNLGLRWIYERDSRAIVWLINPDAYLWQTSFTAVNSFFDTYPEISIVGTIIHTPAGKIWFAGGCFIPRTGGIIAQDLLTNSATAYVECDWVSGCSLLMNLCNFSECPQFDPAYFLYYEDFELCWRYASQGHLVAVTQRLIVRHQPSTITNRNLFKKFKHSTYSYLLALETSTNQLVLLLRLIRLIAHALLLLPVKPQVAGGKLYGTFFYCQRSRDAALRRGAKQQLG